MSGVLGHEHLRTEDLQQVHQRLSILTGAGDLARENSNCGGLGQFLSFFRSRLKSSTDPIGADSFTRNLRPTAPLRRAHLGSPCAGFSGQRGFRLSSHNGGLLDFRAKRSRRPEAGAAPARSACSTALCWVPLATAGLSSASGQTKRIRRDEYLWIRARRRWNAPCNAHAGKIAVGGAIPLASAKCCVGCWFFLLAAACRAHATPFNFDCSEHNHRQKPVERMGLAVNSLQLGS